MTLQNRESDKGREAWTYTNAPKTDAAACRIGRSIQSTWNNKRYLNDLLSKSQASKWGMGGTIVSQPQDQTGWLSWCTKLARKSTELFYNHIDFRIDECNITNINRVSRLANANRIGRKPRESNNERMHISSCLIRRSLNTHILKKWKSNNNKHQISQKTKRNFLGLNSHGWQKLFWPRPVASS